MPPWLCWLLWSRAWGSLAGTVGCVGVGARARDQGAGTTDRRSRHPPAAPQNFLHTCKPPIIHRDLKSPNLLVDKDMAIKVRCADTCCSCFLS